MNPDVRTSDPVAPNPSSKPKVLIVDAKYDHSLHLVVERIFETFPRDWTEKTVLVKPNILAPHLPEQGVTTHPELIRHIVNALHRRGAKVMVGDNPGVGAYGRSGRSAAVSGIENAAQGCYVSLGQQPVSCPVPSGYFQQVAISKPVLDADIVINVPKLKTHSLTVLTGGIKNTFGYVAGGDKMRIHSACPRPWQFARALVDILSIRPPELTIMDAVLGMQGNGPANGSPVHLGKILASDNVVSLDAVATAFLGQKPSAVPHIKEAGKRGLGQIDIGRIPVLGEWQPITNFRFPQTFLPGLAGFVLNRCLSRWINCLPEILPAKCRQCGLCVSHCPAGAMHMTEHGPELDPSRCIHCYCCQELCPEDAIRLTGRLLSLLRKKDQAP